MESQENNKRKEKKVQIECEGLRGNERRTWGVPVVIRGVADKPSSLFPYRAFLLSLLSYSPTCPPSTCCRCSNVFYHQKHLTQVPPQCNISSIIKSFVSLANLNPPLSMQSRIRVHLSMAETRLSSLFIGDTLGLPILLCVTYVPRLIVSRVAFSLLMAEPFVEYTVPFLWRCTGPGE